MKSKSLLSILGISLLTGCGTMDGEYLKRVPRDTWDVLFGQSHLPLVIDKYHRQGCRTPSYGINYSQVKKEDKVRNGL